MFPSSPHALPISRPQSLLGHGSLTILVQGGRTHAVSASEALGRTRPPKTAEFRRALPRFFRVQRALPCLGPPARLRTHYFLAAIRPTVAASLLKSGRNPAKNSCEPPLRDMVMQIHRSPILIVDDDGPFRELVSLLLERAGYAAAEAANGEEAFAAVSDERPAAVLLDVQLDGISGYAICRELRQRFGEQLPIIFVSGARVEPSDRVAGLLIGADDYMTKPLDADELLARVGRALTRVDAAERSSNGAGAASRLTPRERDVLRLLAEGLGTDAIAKNLYISPKTVGTHVQRM